MQTTRNPLPDQTHSFFFRMEEYLDLPLYYYGSIQRADYVPGKSDIDTMLFTDNEQATVEKMAHFLGKPRSEFRKIVWDIRGNIVYGYKIKYDDPSIPLYAEISIYNEKFRDIIQHEQTRKFELPFYITWMLFVLKAIYYRLQLLSEKQYTWCKRTILNTGLGEKDALFLVLPNKKNR